MSERHEPAGVLVVDGEVETRDLFEAIFELADDFRLLAAVSEADVAVALAKVLRPAVVVVDVEAIEMTAGARVRQIHGATPSSLIVAVSGFPDPITLLDVLGSGAAGYVDKGTAWRDLLPTVRAVCRDPHALG